MGRYETGEKLPSEIELARLCGVNRNTLRHAIGELTAQGILNKTKGIGTFVAASEPVILRHKLNHISSFGQELNQAGISEKTILLEKGYETAVKHIAQCFSLKNDSCVIAVRRLIHSLTVRPKSTNMSCFNTTPRLTKVREINYIF